MPNGMRRRQNQTIPTQMEAIPSTFTEAVAPARKYVTTKQENNMMPAVRSMKIWLTTLRFLFMACHRNRSAEHQNWH
jgi:hypothetical protein